MIEILRKRRNRQQLDLLHPAHAARFEALLVDMHKLGRPRLQDTWRSVAAQEAKHRAGLSAITSHGPHTNVLLTEKGVAPASLATHFLDDDAPLNPSLAWMAELAVRARYFGLQTGLAWSRTDEGPLAPGTPHRVALDAAIESGDVDKVLALIMVDRGFDPLHVEVQGWRKFYRR